MKIEYIKSKKDYPMLSEIPAGTVFSPIGSSEIGLKLDKDGMSDVFIDSYTILRRETWNIQDCDDDFENYEEIIAVTHLGSGTLCFLNKNIKVNPLNCKLVVEE